MANANASSLDVIEEFFGQELSQAHLSVLKEAPEEQIGELFDRLNNGWVDWFDHRFDKGLAPDKHYFLGENISSVEPLPMTRYKQLALYFPSIATRDPLEAKLNIHVQVAQAIGQIWPGQLRGDLISGLEALMEIAPLIRAGAIDIVPAGQAGMSEGVQDVARREVKSERTSGDDENDFAGAFGFATGLCRMLAYWPVASTEPFWKRLDLGGKQFATELAHCNIPITQAVASFNVPSVSRIELSDLLRLRANDEAFSDFRETFGVAIREAMDQGVKHGQKYAEEALRDRLKPHEARCNDRPTSMFDGMLLPGAAALMVGGLSWILATGDKPMSGLDNVKNLLVNASAPGIAWLILTLLQQRRTAADPRGAIYSALIDRVDGS